MFDECVYDIWVCNANIMQYVDALFMLCVYDNMRGIIPINMDLSSNLN